jgi:hypothetical protein
MGTPEKASKASFQQATMKDFTNLVTATYNDCGSILQLTATNASIIAKINALATEVAYLNVRGGVQGMGHTSSIVVPVHGTSWNDNPSTTTHTSTPRNPIENYCWTHRWVVPSSHSSQSCTNKRYGHNTEATRENTLGGSSKGWYFAPQEIHK